MCVTKRPLLDQKTQNQKLRLSFFLPIPFSFNNKNTKTSWNPYFYSVLANLKKDNFQNFNSKHRKLGKPIFAPFFEKIFLENGRELDTKNTQNDNWEKIAWNHYKYRVFP